MVISCPLEHDFTLDEIRITQCIYIHHHVINEEIPAFYELAMSVVETMKSKINPYQIPQYSKIIPYC